MATETPTYNPQEIEPKWQEYWQHLTINQAIDFSNLEKKYILIEFPYPSGIGLHVGHVWGYTMADVVSRKHRMSNKNVLFPIGWDAFGLPAENYAIKTGIHPTVSTAENITNFKTQMNRLGLSFDWSREINTTDPEYYKWTQWIFLQLFKKGLAYQAEIPINWCPFCKTGLADEEVTSDNKHERCGTLVTKRRLRQWLLKITAYADRLIKDLDDVDYSDDIKNQQINWIGRSEGAKIRFKLAEDLSTEIEVFTTRADTLPGATFLVLAPEHPLALTLPTNEHRPAVEEYVGDAAERTLIERTDEAREKTGVFTGQYAINPYTNEPIPIWIADYVLGEYGTGAIMGVPFHDERDGAFATVYELPQTEVSELGDEATSKMLELAQDGKWGEPAVTYKLHDWVFSRQRYWGEPIPLIHCPKCGVVPVPESELPLLLPEVESYQPSGDGQSPLANISDWVNVACPECGGAAERETNTMPNWAGSSWYFLRFIDPHNSEVFADAEKLKYYMPVDLYIGGSEHTTLHLLYSRFWHKFLFDQGLVPTHEPYAKRRNRGLILGPDGRKMSKSFGNVINPLDVIKEVGADTLRIYELFMGPFQGTFPWNYDSVRGVYRFLERVWRLCHRVNTENKSSSSKEVVSKLHQTIKKVGEDIDSLKFNTAVAAMMEFLNIADNRSVDVSPKEWELFLRILAPFAPFISEELWQKHYRAENESIVSIGAHSWPEYDESLIVSEIVEIPVQVNGKLRTVLTFSIDDSTEEASVVKRAQSLPIVSDALQNKTVTKTIYLPKKLLNFVAVDLSEEPHRD